MARDLRKGKFMKNEKHRRFTSANKLKNLGKNYQCEVTASDISRRQELATSVLYRSKTVTQGESAVVPTHDAQRVPRRIDIEAMCRVGDERLHAVVAEITAENVVLIKSSEAGGVVAWPCADANSRDAFCSASSTTLQKAGASRARRLERVLRQVLRLEVVNSAELSAEV